MKNTLKRNVRLNQYKNEARTLHSAYGMGPFKLMLYATHRLRGLSPETALTRTLNTYIREQRYKKLRRNK